MSLEELSVAYIVLVHKNVEQVNLLLEQMLEDENVDIFVHIDSKAHHVLSDRIMKHDRIKVLEDCIDVTWGDISVVNATLLLLEEVVRTHKNYDYVCLRSGQDLMVKKGLSAFLAMNRENVFIEANPVQDRDRSAAHVHVKWPRFTRRLYGPAHPFRWLRSLIPRMYALGINPFPSKSKLPPEIKLYRGSQWFCLTYEAAKYIVDYVNKNPWYYHAFENVLIADEWFFHTLIMNSPFAGKVIKRNLTYLTMGQSFKERHHPLTIQMRDIPGIEDSGDFFARKFDIETSPEVIKYFLCKK